MINWIFLSFLQPAIYTVVIFTDKYILERQIKDYRSYAIFSAIVGLTAGTFLWVISGFPILILKDSLLVLFSGVLAIFASAIYFSVMSKVEASKVIFMLQLIPVIVLLLSLLFLGERMGLKAYTGFILIFLSTFMATLNKGQNFSLSISKPLILMMIACFFWACASVIFKFVSDTTHFVKLICFESWGWAIGGLILYSFFPSVRKAFFKTIKNLSKPALAVVFGNEIIYVISRLVGFWAISLGPVFLVSAINGTDVFFGVLYGWILTLIAPKVFKEDITKKSLFKKFALATLVVFGIYLIS